MFDAFRYPVSGDGRFRTLAVGVSLSSLGALVLPAVPVAGYYGRVLASSSTGRVEPPRFDGWGALFVQGLKTWTVVAIYLLVGLFVLLALGVTALVLGELGTGGALVGALALIVGVLLLLGLFMIPAWFFFPAALIHVARTDSVTAAFDVRTIAGVATDRRYLGAWAGGVVVLLLGSLGYVVAGGTGGLLAGLLLPGTPVSGASIAGHVVGAGINFYCQVVAFHLFGRGYGAAIETSYDADPESSPTPAVEGKPDPEYDGWGAESRAWRERRRRERDDSGR